MSMSSMSSRSLRSRSRRRCLCRACRVAVALLSFSLCLLTLSPCSPFSASSLFFLLPACPNGMVVAPLSCLRRRRCRCDRVVALLRRCVALAVRVLLTVLVWRAQLRARRERDAASRSVRFAVEVAHVVAHTRCRRAALCARSGGKHAAAEVTSFLGGAARLEDCAVVLRVMFARVPNTNGKRGGLSQEQSSPRFPRSLCSPRLRTARTHRSPLRPTTCARSSPAG